MRYILAIYRSALLILAFLLTVALPAAAGGGNVDADALSGKIKAFASDFPDERVYLHIDNTGYLLGETVHFVAYVMRSDSLVPSGLSRYVYVDLLNAAGIPVAFKKFELRGGRAAGSVELPRTLQPGFYELRGYTSWMLNFGGGEPHAWEKFNTKAYRSMLSDNFHKFVEGNAGIFSRVFPVYGVHDDGTRDIGVKSSPVAEDTTLYVDFYPEGGNMVSGVGSRIAYAAHDGRGRGLSVDGRVMLGDREVAHIESNDEGRGVFTLDAGACSMGQSLTLRVCHNGRDYEFGLPKVRSRGYALRVIDNGGYYEATVSRNGATAGDRLVMAVLCRQRAGMVSDVDMTQSAESTVRVDKSRLSTGVNAFVLYNGAGNVLARRLVFAMGGDSLRYAGSCSAVLDTIGTDGIARLRLAACDGNGAPVSGAGLSVAIRQTAGDGDADGHNLLADLLLSSEVRGYIHNIDRYFSSGRVVDSDALDLLMLVQGWTRYDFEAMSGAGSFVPLYPMERSLSFEGMMCDRHGQDEQTRWKPLKDGYFLYADMLLDGKPSAVEVKVKDGRFSIPLPDFEGDGDIWLSLNKRSVSELGKDKAGVSGHMFKTQSVGRYYDKAMVPLNAFPPLGKDYSWYETQIDSGVHYRMSKGLEYVATVGFGALTSYLSNAYGCVSKLSSPPVTARSLFRLMGVDGHGSVHRPGEPVYGDSAWLSASGAERTKMFMRIMRNPLSPDQCIGASIYTLRPDRRQMHMAAKYGETINGEDDISGWYTPHGEGGYNKYQDGPVTSHMELLYDFSRAYSGDNGSYQGYHILVKGVDKPAEFFKGDYRYAPHSDADCRSTLYWNPDVVLDANGEAVVVFPCPTKYKGISVSAEGITPDGQAVVTDNERLLPAH